MEVGVLQFQIIFIVTDKSTQTDVRAGEIQNNLTIEELIEHGDYPQGG
jgi:hypothetical protein